MMRNSSITDRQKSDIERVSVFVIFAANSSLYTLSFEIFGKIAIQIFHKIAILKIVFLESSKMDQVFSILLGMTIVL